jgi:hypothetical protein
MATVTDVFFEHLTFQNLSSDHVQSLVSHIGVKVWAFLEQWRKVEISAKSLKEGSNKEFFEGVF